MAEPQLTDAELIKVRELIAPGSLVDKLLQRQQLNNEKKEAIDSTNAEILPLSTQITEKQSTLQTTLQEKNEAIAALGLGE